jgi:hypothetical protein
VRTIKPTIIFDFDGVIHSYTSGWQGVTNIPDPPVPGIKEAIRKIREEYRIIVVSTRCFQPGGIEAIQEYLAKHEIEIDGVVAEKVPAILSVDDRTICFDGKPEGLMEKIKNFKPWNKLHFEI